MHDYWWRDASWARCKCGEYLCVVGHEPTTRAEAVADQALMIHAETPAWEGSVPTDDYGPWGGTEGCFGHCDPEGWYAKCRESGEPALESGGSES